MDRLLGLGAMALALVCTLGMVVSPAFAAVPNKLTVQGRVDAFNSTLNGTATILVNGSPTNFSGAPFSTTSDGDGVFNLTLVGMSSTTYAADGDYILRLVIGADTLDIPLNTAAFAFRAGVADSVAPGVNIQAGIVQMTAFTLSSAASSGFILTSDASGNGSWQPAPSGGGGGASSFSSTDSIVITADSDANGTGTILLQIGMSTGVFVSTMGNIGIGHSAPAARLDVISDIILRNRPFGTFPLDSFFLGFGEDQTLPWRIGKSPSANNLVFTSQKYLPGFPNGPKDILTIVDMRGFLCPGGCVGPLAVGGVKIDGGLTVTGTKSFVQDHPTDATKQIVYYAAEGPEAVTFVRGTAHLSNGQVTVALPDHFAMVTSATAQITVHLTPGGDCKGLFTAQKDRTQITVKEFGGGVSNVNFDYLVQGIRTGYENLPVIQNK
ncbi:MAG: hypothetical protein HY923_02565 [Elusimicrobia bacterium]|nr:hypothetical protein [Elusimicrobiota bacterium]